MELAFDPNAAAAPGSGAFGLPHTPEQAQVVLVPVPFEATTSYGQGAARGPEAIRAASRQVDLFDVETGRPYEGGIAMIDPPPEVQAWNDQATALAKPIVAAGGAESDPALSDSLKQVNALCARMNEWVETTVDHWLARGKLVGTVGGDHSVSFGAIRAHARHWPGLGVLHLDAHADLRQAYEGFTWSHASVMYNVAVRLPEVARLVQVGIRDLGEAEHRMISGSGGRIAAFFDAEIQTQRFEGTPFARQIEQMLAPLPQYVYVSFDIDGLDPTLCPGTGTPVPGGLSFAEACALLRGLVKSGRRIVGFDLTEVAPSPDGGEWDGNVGARLLYKMIGWSLLSRPRG